MGLDRCSEYSSVISELRLTGGGAGSAIWRQMVADVFNMPVRVPTVGEGAALGAALEVLWMYRPEQGDTIPLQELVDTHLQLDLTQACVTQRYREQRYRSFDSGDGALFEQGQLDLVALRDMALQRGEPAHSSGKQEWYENVINQYL